MRRKGKRGEFEEEESPGEREEEAPVPGREVREAHRTPGFWVRLSLLLALIAYGIFLALRASEEVKRAQAERYGLVDNDGRTARVVFRDPIARKEEEYVLLLCNADRSETKALALLHKVDWLDGVLLYWSDYVRYPVGLDEGTKGVLFLTGDGIVVSQRSCPRGYCVVVPPVPYKGVVKLKRPPVALVGSQMDLLTYGDWLYRP